MKLIEYVTYNLHFAYLKPLWKVCLVTKASPSFIRGDKASLIGENAYNFSIVYITLFLVQFIYGLHRSVISERHYNIETSILSY